MRIANDGPVILSTDYWTSEHAQRGLLYLSVNAGALRLLVPPASTTTILDEISAASRAAVQIATAGEVGIVHLVFEDDSPAPFFLSLDVRQIDRSLPAAEAGRWVTLDLYTQGDDDRAQLVRSLPALIRRATPQVDSAHVSRPPQAPDA